MRSFFGLFQVVGVGLFNTWVHASSMDRRFHIKLTALRLYIALVLTSMEAYAVGDQWHLDYYHQACMYREREFYGTCYPKLLVVC